MPIIGILDAASFIGPKAMAALREGLGEAGFVEGQNVAFEYRSADGYILDRRRWRADLVRRKVAVIIAALAPAFAAKAATSTIPIVFANGSDPVKFGLVADLGRPGVNITGVTFFTSELSEKRLELLCEMIPELTLRTRSHAAHAHRSKWHIASAFVSFRINVDSGLTRSPVRTMPQHAEQ